MALYLNQTKKNPKTGKNEKTGKLEQVGNVSRGSAGGYTKGVITGQQPSGATDIRGQPIYGAPDTAPRSSNFQPIVPNSLPSPVSNMPPDGAGAIPNSPFVNGYVPPQQPQPTTPLQTPPPAGSVSAPLPSPSPQEASNQPVPGTLPPGPVNFIPGGEPVLPQGTQSGAVAEVTPGDVMVLQGFSQLAVSVTRTLANLAKDAAIASTVGGAEVLAVQALPAAASGVAKEGVKTTGKVVGSSASMKQIVNILKATGIAGISVPMVISLVKSSVAGADKFETDVTADVVEMGELMNNLLRSEDPTLIAEGNKLYGLLAQIDTDSNKVRAYIPYGLFQGDLKGKFNELDVAMSKVKTDYNNFVQDNAVDAALQELDSDPSAESVARAKQYLSTLPEGPAKTRLRQGINDVEIQSENIAQSNALRAEFEKQAFQAQQTKLQQEFQTSEREARQAYEQSVRDAANQQKAFDEATATTASDGSSLSFGLLGTGGATEFVDRDTASNAYFGKVYSELTPAQQRLLNLLKGKGQ